jgi:hypothetical protein
MTSGAGVPMAQPETRIVLRSDQAGEGNDKIVDHPGQPEFYVDADGVRWNWQSDQAWRLVGGVSLRIYDPMPSN